MPSPSFRVAFPAVVVSLACIASAVACSSSSSKETGTTHDAAGGGVDGGKTHSDGGMSQKDGGGKSDGGGKTTSDGGGGDGATSGIAPPLVLPAPTANITWGKNTIYLDQAQAMTLVKTIDTPDDIDGGTTQSITINGPAAKTAGLTFPDKDCIVIFGQVMREITGSSTDASGDIVLETADTSLDLCATDAELKWEQAMELNPEAAMAAINNPMGQLKVDHKKGLSVSQGMLSYTATYGGYDYDVNLEMYGDTADVDITITKGTTAKFTVQGTLERFVVSHYASVTGGNLESYMTSIPGVKGSLTLSVVAAGSLTDKDNFTLPVPLLEYPELIGPIPVVMEVSAQFTINGSVTITSSVDVEASFDYDSTLGFTSNGATVGPAATMGSPMIQKMGSPKSASSLAAAFSAGLGFPRVQVSAFGKTLVGWIQPAFVVGGSFTFMPACQTATAEFLASGGYSLSILSHKIASGSTVFFEDPETLLESPEGCADGGT